MVSQVGPLDAPTRFLRLAGGHQLGHDRRTRLRRRRRASAPTMNETYRPKRWAAAIGLLYGAAAFRNALTRSGCSMPRDSAWERSQSTKRFSAAFRRQG